MVELNARMAFIGVSKEPNRWKPGETTYKLQFSKGTDSLQFHVDKDVYDHFSEWEEFARCDVLVGYNPMSSKVAYAMTFLNAIPLEELYSSAHGSGATAGADPAKADPGKAGPAKTGK